MLICKICEKKYEYKKGNGSSLHVCVACRNMYRKRIMKRKMIEYKGGKCEICGYDKNDNAFDFHHIDPSDKKYSLSGKYNLSFEKLKDELDKCMLLCSNCHRELHAKENHTIEEIKKYKHN